MSKPSGARPCREEEVVRDADAAALPLPRCGEAVQHEGHDQRVHQAGDVQ